MVTSLLRRSLHLFSSFRLLCRDHFVPAYVRCVRCSARIVVSFVIHMSSFSRIASLASDSLRVVRGCVVVECVVSFSFAFLSCSFDLFVRSSFVASS